MEKGSLQVIVHICLGHHTAMVGSSYGIFHLCQNCLPPTGVSLSFYSTPKVTLISLTLADTLCWSLSFFTACLFQYSLKISNLILKFPKILINVMCLLQGQKFIRGLGKNALNVILGLLICLLIFLRIGLIYFINDIVGIFIHSLINSLAMNSLQLKLYSNDCDAVI